jgi:hypothetical protein
VRERFPRTRGIAAADLHRRPMPAERGDLYVGAYRYIGRPGQLPARTQSPGISGCGERNPRAAPARVACRRSWPRGERECRVGWRRAGEPRRQTDDAAGGRSRSGLRVATTDVIAAAGAAPTSGLYCPSAAHRSSPKASRTPPPRGGVRTHPCLATEHRAIVRHFVFCPDRFEWRAHGPQQSSTHDGSSSSLITVRMANPPNSRRNSSSVTSPTHGRAPRVARGE